MKEVVVHLNYEKHFPLHIINRAKKIMNKLITEKWSKVSFEYIDLKLDAFGLTDIYKLTFKIHPESDEIDDIDQRIINSAHYEQDVFDIYGKNKYLTYLCHTCGPKLIKLSLYLRDEKFDNLIQKVTKLEADLERKTEKIAQLEEVINELKEEINKIKAFI
jgi:cell division protein FtsL